MARVQSVVTAERFAEGCSYNEFLEWAGRDRILFERNARRFELADSDKQFFSGLAQEHGALKVIALVETW
jgi:hypothetical protein